MTLSRADSETRDSGWDVIVTNASTRVAYNILRSLAGNGLKVGLGTDSRSGMALYSRLCGGSFRHPSHYRDSKGFLAAVRKAVIAHHPAVYIPADEDAYMVAEHMDQLRDLPARTALAPFETLRQLDDKYESLRVADSLGIPTPATILPKSFDEIEVFAREHPGPLMLKLIRSSGARGVFLLPPDRPRALLSQIFLRCGKSFSDFIVQEFIRASGYGVSLLLDHGEPKAIFAHRRLRERSPRGGPSTLRQSVRLPTLEGYAERLLRHVGYHGVAMVEFKHDEATGKCWFLEVNPRWWGSLALAIQSGVDFPWLFYRMALGEDLPAPPDYRVGVTVRWLLGDLLALKNHLLSARRLPRFRELCPKVDGYDDVFADEKMPLAAEFFLHLKKTALPKPWSQS